MSTLATEEKDLGVDTHFDSDGASTIDTITALVAEDHQHVCVWLQFGNLHTTVLTISTGNQVEDNVMEEGSSITL